MNIGIFAKTFVRPTLAETLDAVAQHGIRDVQFARIQFTPSRMAKCLRRSSRTLSFGN